MSGVRGPRGTLTVRQLAKSRSKRCNRRSFQMFSDFLHGDNPLAKDTEIWGLGSCRRCEWLGERRVDCLDLCGGLGFDLERMQTRVELLC